jgi:hypothetical protein
LAGVLATTGEGWCDYRPAQRRVVAGLVTDAPDLPPVVESGTVDGPSDPPPPGSAELLRAGAGAGVTALAGRVLQSDGSRLKCVEHRLGTLRGWTDDNGLFLIEGATLGYGVMIIDGCRGQAQGAPQAIDHLRFPAYVTA